jgi:phage head maturation protease
MYNENMKQTRFIPIEDCGLQIRETEFGQGKSRTVVGRPVMFGVRSVNLTPWSDTRVVYEILEPNCITQELINRSNVVYNNNHSNDISDMIGRCVNGKGTLSLVLRENYMESSCDYPNTTVANDTLEHIRLGNVYGMSFAFDDRNANGEENVTYERTNETVDGKEVWLRHVWLITKLFDVANVTHPAYEQTSVATREMSEAIDKAIEEQLKRECGGKDDDKRDCGKDDTKRDDDPDDKDDIKDDDPDDKDDKDDADDEAKRAAEEEAKKKAEEEEAAKREAEAKAKAEQEARELEEQEQRFREQQAMRLRHRAMRLRTEQELESLSY